MALELNFDGLVGPSHHYGGASLGNLASAAHEGHVSDPRAAALQGLAKMRVLVELGVPQAVLPPHPRPDLFLARRMGFSGTDTEVLDAVARAMPPLLAACYSSASMWAANAATVTPSVDTADGKVHFTSANLQHKAHRSIEWPTTARILRAIFPSPAHFEHHDPLPSTAGLGDEGAANQARLAPAYAAPGVHLFVYGECAALPLPRPRRFAARQTLEACLGLSRLHRLDPRDVVLAQQNPAAIDLGVFHNDVICVADRDVFFVHEEAFVDQPRVLDQLRSRYRERNASELRVLEVPREAVPVEVAVATYLFNSQLVTTPRGQTVLVAPRECEGHPAVAAYVRALVEGPAPLDAVRYVDLRQSMHGGGGPACLRLRVVLDEAERAAMHPGVRFTPDLDAALASFFARRYRDRLAPADLADPSLLQETRETLDELTQLLGLGSIYPFQTTGEAWSSSY